MPMHGHLMHGVGWIMIAIYLHLWFAPYKRFKLALEKMNAQPEEVLMIGDWPDRDVVGAKQIGMKTIFARYGDTFGTKESGADWDVDDIYDIVGIVKELNNV